MRTSVPGVWTVNSSQITDGTLNVDETLRLADRAMGEIRSGAQAAPAAAGRIVTRSVASLSLDLDNEWSYLKVHGDDGWESLPSFLDVVVPRALGVLDDLGLTATWFIVGLDAAQDRNRDALGSISDAGHEIGNHSHRHEPWLHLYTDAELVARTGRGRGGHRLGHRRAAGRDSADRATACR